MRYEKKKACLLTAIAISGIMLCIFNPADYLLWPKCPTKILTGLSCPSCGIQRFIHALLNGNVAEAISYNYYLLFALPYALALLAGFFMPQCKSKDTMNRTLQNKYTIRTYVVSFILWFVIRNILKI